MKKWMKAVAEFKTWACLCFTVEMVIYAGCCLIFGQAEMESVMVFELLGVAVAVSLLQFVFFSGRFLKKTRYSVRLLLFSIPMLGLLSLCAVLFHWFPVENGWAWLTFVATFVVMLLCTTLGFEIYFRAAGKKYDGLLGQYRANRAKKP